MAPKKGARFIHANWISPRDNGPQEFAVTRVAQGMVYYRAVYHHSDRESLGGAMKSPVAEFPRYVKEWVA